MILKTIKELPKARMQEFHWGSAVAGAIATAAAGLVVALTIFTTRSLVNRAKKLIFVAEDWKLTYFVVGSAGGWAYQDQPNNSDHAKIGGTVKFFTRRQSVVALHKLSIEFRQGKWRHGRLIERLTNLSHGDSFIRGAQECYEKLTELSIPNEQWIVERIHASIKDYDSVKGASVWLSAETAEGKRRMWLLTRLAS
ncbi:MAG TPA: hypothetical protein VHY91_09555 [Pirellulales bacterium]|nr:hypothetical protein [Pirellulales bacterium]